MAVKAARGLVVLIAVILAMLGIAIGLLETGWGKGQLRGLIVRQANQYLTANLSIGRLEGSLFRGLELGDVILSRDGNPIVAIDEVSVSYSPRELWEGGTVIRELVVTRPRIAAARQPDGRWNLGALVRRDAQQRERTGPRRRIEIERIKVIDASVTLADPLKFGAANVPTEFMSLNLSMSFAYAPVRWTLVFDHGSFVGHAPDLTIDRIGGTMGRGSDGWFFDDFSIQTPRSAFDVDGTVLIGDRPTVLDLDVKAERFAFQEWSGIVTGLKNIAVEAAFDTTLDGPLTDLDTQLTISGTGGSVKGRVALNTRVPGWHGRGAVDVARIDLARWLNRPDRPSDINGHLTFDLDLDLGRRFPRGTYAFNGMHTMYMGYAADNLRAVGRLVPGRALIDRLAAVAYGADITGTTGSISLDNPYPYNFQGSMSGLDLRRVPEEVPVPHVDSVLAFDYDVAGQFSRPFITGRARFATSAFLGATLHEGMVGTIDTAVQPIRYSGDGTIEQVDLNRFGEGLDVGWLKDPRYAGTIAGQFRVDGTGGSSETLAISAEGRFSRAELFRGTVTDADASLELSGGSLRSTFSGRLAGIDPSVAFGDPRFGASLTGTADVQTTVRDLLIRMPTLADYEVTGRMMLDASTVRGVHLDAAAIDASLAAGRLTVSRLSLSGPAIAGTGSGEIALDPNEVSDFEYDITRGDLAELAQMAGATAAGQMVTKGRLSGPRSALRAVGTGTFSNLKASGIDALAVTADYDITVPSAPPGGRVQPTAVVEGRGTFVNIFGQAMNETSGKVTLESDRAEFDLTLTQTTGRTGDMAGAIMLHPDRHGIDLLDLTVTLGSMPWRLVSADTAPGLRWDEAGITVAPTTFATGHEDDQRIEVEGTWRYDGTGKLNVAARHAFLETFQNADNGPPRFGGAVDLDAVVRGTRDAPIVTGTVAISNGRVERVAYDRLAGRVDYTGGNFEIDLRLDQSPGTFLTATGTLPRSLFDSSAPERPINIAIMSSPIDLGLLAGVTDVVVQSSGQVRLDVRAVGTSADPHFEGSIDIVNAAFLVADTGVRYQNGHAVVRLSPDVLTVESFHLEDGAGRALEMKGSLGTHELRVSDVAIDMTATRFEVLRNEFGRLDISAMLSVRGRSDAPRIAGEVTLNGDQLDVDEILNRILFRPYSTEPVEITAVDAVAALNPWDRLGLDIELHVPRTLRLAGTDIQVSPGTPIGLGDINLRVGGDLYLYKDPGGPVYPTGSLDQVSGSYVFQGRRFDIDEASSSINFVGDLDPQIWIMVTREITAVETRVTLSGSLRQPELQLASTPPLDESDILSLIVFNTTPNALTAVQQEQLAVRAGTLAAGFLAKPLLQAVQNELGLEAFQIETTGEAGAGPRVTIAGELAPGLVARFSRQFGQEAYDVATLEYYLSALFRLRATFSDAQSVSTRSAFRRLERAGIDLIVFFSF
jgi:autotransporter translocation and assembly factor TamB